MLPLQNLGIMIEPYSGLLMNTYILKELSVHFRSATANDVIGEDPGAPADNNANDVIGEDPGTPADNNEWLKLIPMLMRLMVMSSMYLTPGQKNSLMNMAVMEIAIGSDEGGRFIF